MSDEQPEVKYGRLDAEPGSDFDLVMFEYAEAKAAEAEAKERVSAAKAAVLRATGAIAEARGVDRVDVFSRYGNLNVSRARPWKLNTKAIKSDHPEFWAAYAYQADYWEIRSAKV